ncbi:CinA family protein [Nakamurella flava]|uniref:CinA family protein n=1 Tax=Nakamurella flava TaxID=2576308 RepID=A0A4U6QBM1_9ACTN|nr:CinA family protein [Nakamurella flava]TKV57370.1 CinA family protein [Nakamurella flava]
MADVLAELAGAVADLVDERGLSVAAAESVTAGRVATALAAAPSSAAWFRGSLVAYHSEVKFSLLEVPEGPVITGDTARRMATRVRSLLGADVAVSSTGAGGPDAEESQPPGTVFLAVATADGCSVRRHHFTGEPPDVVEQAAAEALRELRDVLRAGAAGGPP